MLYAPFRFSYLYLRTVILLFRKKEKECLRLGYALFLFTFYTLFSLSPIEKQLSVR